MLVEAGAGLLFAAVGSGVTYVWLKNSSSKKFAYMQLEAQAKAQAIEHESERILQDSKVKIKEDEFALEKTFQDRLQEVEKRNRNLIMESREFKKEEEKLQKLQFRATEKSYLTLFLRIIRVSTMVMPSSWAMTGLRSISWI